MCFTDGSALGNPGPCGAAVVSYTDGLEHQPISNAEAVSKLSSSYHGEIRALWRASDILLQLSHNRNFSNAHILCDCISAIHSVASSEIHKSHQKEIDSFRLNIFKLKEKGTNVTCHWIPEIGRASCRERV